MTPKKVTLRISTEKHEDKLDKDGEARELRQPPAVFGWCQLFKVSIS